MKHLNGNTVDRLAPAGLMLGGAAWIGLVAWFVIDSINRTAGMVADGSMTQPTSAQVLLVYAMGVFFALPGLGLIVYGLVQRRPRGHHHDASPD